MVIKTYYDWKLFNKNITMTNSYHEIIFKSFLLLLTQNRYILVKLDIIYKK